MLKHDDDFDLDHILKDGESMRVPMMKGLRMNDAMALRPGQHSDGRKATISDGYGNTDPLALCKPGFRVSSTAAYDNKMYDEYDVRISTAYRDADNSHTASITGAGEKGHAGWRVGDVCMVKSRRDLGEDGDRGRVERDEETGELICVSDCYRSEDGLDTRDHATRMADLYSDYEKTLAEAWRNPPTH